ncbi:bifunctional riboflavin kinase/FAD synthetase [soil metagenome]
MIVIRDLEAFPVLARSIVTSGTFDGVHVGHQKILSRLIETARQSGGQSVVVTYWPHPRLVLAPQHVHELRLISTIEERIAHLSAFDLDYLLIIPFTKEFSSLSPEEYVQKILLDTLHTKKLVIGYDHHFGRNREGNFEFLRANADRFGFTIEEIPRQDIDEVGVSSTKIRQALEAGEVHQASRFLGRPYSLTGTVVEGKQLGRTIGYPTANLQVAEPFKLIPAPGVYAVRVTVEGSSYGAMLNIGFRPTIGGTSLSIEAHLFNFSGDLYTKEVQVAFVERLRDEQKFGGLDELKAQLAKDKEAALRIVKS